MRQWGRSRCREVKAGRWTQTQRASWRWSPRRFSGSPSCCLTSPSSATTKLWTCLHTRPTEAAGSFSPSSTWWDWMFHCILTPNTGTKPSPPPVLTVSLALQRWCSQFNDYSAFPPLFLLLFGCLIHNYADKWRGIVLNDVNSCPESLFVANNAFTGETAGWTGTGVTVQTALLSQLMPRRGSELRAHIHYTLHIATRGCLTARKRFIFIQFTAKVKQIVPLTV